MLFALPYLLNVVKLKIVLVTCYWFWVLGAGITNAVSFAGGLDLSAWAQLKAKADRFVLLGCWVLVLVTGYWVVGSGYFEHTDTHTLFASSKEP
jgi:hypothetical protein